ncbi:alpha-L-fucosidase [uncultured Sphingomonas sp.]|uniref:alpha-L-fucosidase n=1 Tax=uncultured Sphingomonas sp. TaxID=158754 RepID=UPI0025D43A7F|nr:alpha-L-fucosidase [uncultured Sphingomonas sp.]
MKVNRRDLLGAVGVAGASTALGGPASAATAPAGDKPFAPSWTSLAEGYRAPDWYRDAKFGMWAHWGPQCVPEEGDWYARNMYLQGSRAYNAHVRKYGHPSKVGFLDIIGQWKAEKWDPERQLDLYQRAGAKYFVALANHHDNLDTFASPHPWNTTRVGPKRDIIGTWAKLAKARGLRFGVSNHSAHSWHWYQPAYGYDAEGPLQGKRYDADWRTKADGRGTWWDGLDPQQLYNGPIMRMPDGYVDRTEADGWHERTDNLWNEGKPIGRPDLAAAWVRRCRALIDNYQPDLLYFDDFDLPMEELGLEMAAYYYNANRRWHGGRLEAVLNVKTTPAQRRMALVDDVERGGKTYIETYPWQTDTCLGNWHYDRALYERDGYKSAATVIHTLCDVVSKNGNLLLNVPMRGDGTIDEKEERIVEAIAAWMGRYGNAIYGTRPWRVHGEGPGAASGGMFSETQDSKYTAKDIRYVRKGEDVHALMLGWPEDGVARLTLFANGNMIGRGQVVRVTLFGDSTPLPFRRTDTALEITLPAGAREAIGVPLVLSGPGLVAGSVAQV